MNLLKSLPFIVASVAFSGVAGAAAVSCPGTATTGDREFVMTTDDATEATCISVANWQCPERHQRSGQCAGLRDAGQRHGCRALRRSADRHRPRWHLRVVHGQQQSVPVGLHQFRAGFLGDGRAMSIPTPTCSASRRACSTASGRSNTAESFQSAGSLTRAYIYGYAGRQCRCRPRRWLLLSGLAGLGSVGRLTAVKPRRASRPTSHSGTLAAAVKVPPCCCSRATVVTSRAKFSASGPCVAERGRERPAPRGVVVVATLSINTCREFNYLRTYLAIPIGV